MPQVRLPSNGIFSPFLSVLSPARFPSAPVYLHGNLLNLLSQHRRRPSCCASEQRHHRSLLFASFSLYCSRLPCFTIAIAVVLSYVVLSLRPCFSLLGGWHEANTWSISTPACSLPPPSPPQPAPPPPSPDIKRLMRDSRTCQLTCNTYNPLTLPTGGMIFLFKIPPDLCHVLYIPPFVDFAMLVVALVLFSPCVRFVCSFGPKLCIIFTVCSLCSETVSPPLPSSGNGNRADDSKINLTLTQPLFPARFYPKPAGRILDTKFPFRDSGLPADSPYLRSLANNTSLTPPSPSFSPSPSPLLLLLLLSSSSGSSSSPPPPPTFSHQLPKTYTQEPAAESSPSHGSYDTTPKKSYDSTTSTTERSYNSTPEISYDSTTSTAKGSHGTRRPPRKKKPRQRKTTDDQNDGEKPRPSDLHDLRKPWTTPTTEESYDPTTSATDRSPDSTTSTTQGCHDPPTSTTSRSQCEEGGRGPTLPAHPLTPVNTPTFLTDPAPTSLQNRMNNLALYIATAN
ncbi:hypothetical protein C7M84_018625 [Penaeus vannamei]|uniref:Uncharacterized protein n=1 Tax=Penaeus vannamei TaxID=6689 RepID=A0A3R7LZW5_PENVA|nr:hypothetical protein C7M84_018625 [Penaeus vannamei]